MVQALLNENMKSAEKNDRKPAMWTSGLELAFELCTRNPFNLYIQGIIFGVQTIAF